LGRIEENGGNSGNEPPEDPTDSVSDLVGKFITQQQWVHAYRRALQLTGNAQEAEDIAQEAFERLYRTLEKRTVSEIRKMNLPAYLRRIVNHLCNELLGRRKKKGPAVQQPGREEEAYEVVDEHALQPEQEALKGERKQELVMWLEKLPTNIREVVKDHYFYSLSLSEIVDKRKRPLNTVKSQLHRGITMLRATLTQNPMKEKRSTSGE
jgi:RNA polymerase sigma-70 factor (ECF subfamily)